MSNATNDNQPCNKVGESSGKECCECSCKSEPSRRDFCLTAVGVGVGVGALSVPVYAGARMALYPLQQEGLAGKEYQLATLEGLDETPRLFVVLDDVNDAWTMTPNQTIGVVYLRKVAKDDGSFEITAFQSVCPHAGCRIKVGLTINPKTNQEETLFYCPCHGDVFYLDGERVVPENSKSARSLDSLETRVDESGKVFVKYQNFQLGTSEKKPV